MEYEWKTWACFWLSTAAFLICIVCGITWYSIDENHTFAAGGYVQKQNIGSASYHWEKP